MKNLALLLLSAGLSLGVSQVSTADEVKMPIGSQASDMKVPQKGSVKSRVKRSFGEPRSVEGPVGQPPISKWHYDGFTVYFEYSHVIHSVVHRK